jgi:hypothetical protein
MPAVRRLKGTRSRSGKLSEERKNDKKKARRPQRELFFSHDIVGSRSYQQLKKEKDEMG